MALLTAWLYVHLSVSACLHLSLAVPPQHRGWLRLWEEGEGCSSKCERDRCPLAPTNCPAGLVTDSCGCCPQCGNVEGQLCDPDGAQDFYGRCGEGLRCRKKGQRRKRSDPEPTCVCQNPGPVCGSDGRTYPNLCQFREAASQPDTVLRLTGQGPCYTAPRISRTPRDLTNYTGNDVVFGCEVTAFPLPHLSWKKKGSDNFLPGDDPHISVQARGGPQRYTVSTWLQIEGVRPSDAGIYSCISYNALGQTSASARLTVLKQVMRVLDGYPEEEEDYYYDDTEEGGDDEDPESGDYMQ